MFYYLHGPLRRMELGDGYGTSSIVQGLDYTYTLQGWLKAINGQQLGGEHDPGKDGLQAGGSHPHRAIPADVLGFQLGYYPGDFVSSQPTDAANFWGLPLQHPSTLQHGNALYNGNISYSTAANKALGNGAASGYTYGYDQLNRLVQFRHKPLGTAGSWLPESSAGAAYSETFSYDFNGNIVSAQRKGGSTRLNLDALTYHYQPGTNRLNHVTDAYGSDAATGDIGHQSADNYHYDAIGNLVKDVSEGLQQVNWNVYGKIQSIEKTSGSISYGYDAAGSRVHKLVSGTHQTFYVRDAQGNPIAVYTKDGSGALQLAEHHLYGSSRLGIFERGAAVTTLSLQPNVGEDAYLVGSRFFELSNHLGNVLATVSDKKTGKPGAGGVLEYEADIVGAQDYYAFGMGMPGRSWNGELMKYGFNGKENDNEVKGTGNQQDYGMRIYDPRVGRFLSVDPLTRKFASLTPYQYASNSPIANIDLDGLESLPASSLSKYGEKQVYEISSTAYIGEGWPQITTKKSTPSYAKPVTQNMSSNELYRFVTARMLVPGSFKIAENQYLDEKYFEAEERIKYYFSHHATATMAKGSQSDKLTSEIHNSVVNGLFSDDPIMSDAAVSMIDRRTSFLGKFNWGKTAVEMGAGGLIAGGFRLAVGRMSSALERIGIPKGFGILADPSKWRVSAANLTEQVAMKEAMSGQGSAIMGIGTNKALGDPRLAGMDVTKYEFTHTGRDVLGNKMETTIHYLKNNQTGSMFDFKFTK